MGGRVAEDPIILRIRVRSRAASTLSLVAYLLIVALVVWTATLLILWMTLVG